MLGNPASLQRLWAGVLASLKKSKAAYGVLFMNAKALFDGTHFIIEFASENDFAFRAVQKADVQEELAAALRREAHCDIPFELRKGGAGFGAPVAAVPSADGVARPNPVASAAARAAAQVASVPAPAAAERPGVAVPPAQAADAPALRVQEGAVPVAPMPSADAVRRPVAPDEVPPWEVVSAPMSAPVDDDRPPYDDYVPYDDVDVPVEESVPFASQSALSSASAPAPEVVPGAASAAEQAPAMTSPELPPEPDVVSGPSPNPLSEPDDAELNASLAFGFGDGIAFEEVS